RSVMLQHQDPSAIDSTYSPSSASSSSLRNRKYQDQDGNSNFLSTTTTSPGNKDDENRNQIRPRNLGPLGRDPPSSNIPPGNYGNILSPRSRMPCWTTLEPLPEIESGDDGYGRVPPDGAEEGKVTEEEARAMMLQFEEKQRAKLQVIQRRRSSLGLRAEDREEMKHMENADEWGDTDEDQSSDSDGERGELLDAVWTLRERERFKAQEMERHQTQLTMYRRLALIRWVRTLQTRVQEQQNRLQSSFDLILTHRKELLRVGAAANVANATPTAVSQT
uniref:Uncharacterized protein n=1 Tax=Periophthalmus magnuspinnatus TaxID=409849 RepID=A0A3B4BGK1_9GOBI